MTITTTLNRIHAYWDCGNVLVKLLKGLGKTVPDDEPLPYASIVEISGIDDALWCCRAEPQHAKEWRLFAVWCARQVQYLMTDPRVAAVLDVAERYANGEAIDEELADASSNGSTAFSSNAASAFWSTVSVAALAATSSAASAVVLAVVSSAFSTAVLTAFLTPVLVFALDIASHNAFAGIAATIFLTIASTALAAVVSGVTTWANARQKQIRKFLEIVS